MKGNSQLGLKAYTPRIRRACCLVSGAAGRGGCTAPASGGRGPLRYPMSHVLRGDRFSMQHFLRRRGKESAHRSQCSSSCPSSDRSRARAGRRAGGASGGTCARPRLRRSPSGCRCAPSLFPFSDGINVRIPSRRKNVKRKRERKLTGRYTPNRSSVTSNSCVAYPCARKPSAMHRLMIVYGAFIWVEEQWWDCKGNT